MATDQVNKLLLGFVFVLIGVILTGVLASSSIDTWSKTGVNGEAIDIATARLGSGNGINTSVTFTVANAPSGYKQEDCPLDSVVYGNATTEWTVTTDYTIAADTGILTLVNSSALTGSGSNSTSIDYEYCSDNYVTLAWGRTSITVTYGLFAIGAFGIAIWLFTSIFKDSVLA